MDNILEQAYSASSYQTVATQFLTSTQNIISLEKEIKVLVLEEEVCNAKLELLKETKQHFLKRIESALKDGNTDDEANKGFMDAEALESQCMIQIKKGKLKIKEKNLEKALEEHKRPDIGFIGANPRALTHVQMLPRTNQRARR